MLQRNGYKWLYIAVVQDVTDVMSSSYYFNKKILSLKHINYIIKNI